jgi:hypothetical protein
MTWWISSGTRERPIVPRNFGRKPDASMVTANVQLQDL